MSGFGTPGGREREERGLRIAEVSDAGDLRWGHFVDGHPDGSIYHTEGWLQVLRRAYGFRPLRLLCEDAKGEVCGVLPLAYRRRLGSGLQLSSLPHTPFGGPLTTDPEVTEVLVKEAISRTMAEHGTRLQLKTRGAALEGMVDGLLGQPWDPTWILDLPAEPERLRFGDSRNHGRIRWSVRKAEKLGVRVREADTERELRQWYQLHLEAMRWHGTPPKPYSFFAAIWDIFRPKGHIKLLFAEHRDGPRTRLLSGSIFLVSGRSLFYAFNGRRREDLAFRPNDAIHWSAIHDACTGGFRSYDFGEVMENNPGLAQFKSKWGAEPHPLHRYYHPAAKELEKGILGSDRPVRRLANAGWRRMPLPATAAVGAWMHRHL